MADHKKQHYVPRFYLKRFTFNQRSIGVYNWGAGKAFLEASLKDQCHRDFFYGADLKKEEAFADIEGEVDQYFKLVDRFGVLPERMSSDHDGLLYWIVLQTARTPYSADMVNEMLDQMVKASFIDHPDFKKEDLEGVRVTLDDPVGTSIRHSAASYPLLRDMHLKLLVSPPGTEFITSDTPVASHNQLMTFRSHIGSTTGLVWKGLQIFYPVSSRLLIMLYDSDVYVVGDRKDHWLFLDDKRDVDELNVFQAACSYENFYFRSGVSNFPQIAERARGLRRTSKSKVHIGPKQAEARGNSRIVGTTIQDVRMDMNLTFVRMTKPAKAYRKHAMSQQLLPAVVFRSAEVAKRTEEYKKEQTALRKSQLQAKAPG